MSSIEPLFISVVVPMYESARTVARTIRSILAQTYSNLEILVIDDGSTDNGADIVRSLLRSGDQLVRRERGGVAAARNEGARVSRGSVIAFLDADDAWDPSFLAIVAGMHAAYPDESVYATGYRQRFCSGPDAEVTIPMSGTTVIRDYFRHIRVGPLCMGSLAIRREAFDAAGGFPEGISHGEDLDLWARIGARFNIVYNPAILSTYHRCVPGQATGSIVYEPYRALKPTLETLLADPSLSKEMRADIQLFAMSVASREIGLMLELGRPEHALALLEGTTLLPWHRRLVLRALARRMFQPIVRAVAAAARVPTSRRFVSIMGGQRVVDGMLLRTVPVVVDL